MEDYDENSLDAFGAFFDDDEELDEDAPAQKAEEPLEPSTYVAHYTSPTNASPVKGFFEFDSVYRASSKLNHHDARIRMLEIYGKDAVSWVIDKVKLKRKNDRVCSEQLELDFREPKKPRKKPKPKKYL